MTGLIVGSGRQAGPRKVAAHGLRSAVGSVDGRITPDAAERLRQHALRAHRQLDREQRCRLCGRHLTVEASIAAHVGPECWANPYASFVGAFGMEMAS